jgi:uncharacterized protein (TIGR02996 family)
MQAFLADIHARPEDPAPKLAYADWWDEYDDPRAELIRAREALRQDSASRETLARCLNAAADILGSRAERDAVSASLRSLLELRALITHEADCAARVLCVYERKKPEDDRPRRAVEACRAFAALRLGADALEGAAVDARAAADDVDEPEWSAAVAAAVAAEFGLPYGADSPEMLADSVVEMVAGRERAEVEASWQVGRFIDLWLYGWDYPLPDSERDAV